MNIKDITSLSQITESEFLALINAELKNCIDRPRKVKELEEQLQRLAADTNKLLLCFQMKIVYGSQLEQDSLLTVTDIATMYSKSNKTVLKWIREDGLPAEQIIDDYYVSKKVLKEWIQKKPWEIPKAKRVSKTKKAFFFFRAA